MPIEEPTLPAEETEKPLPPPPKPGELPNPLPVVPKTDTKEIA